MATLNGVYAYDWATFLTTRLHDHGQKAPFDGITRAGYKLVYTDTPSDYFKARESDHKFTDFTYSLGFSVGKDGKLNNVQWEGLGYKAGLTIGQQIVAVNGTAYDPDDLKDLLKADAAAGNADKIDLLVKAGDHYRTVSIDYHGGLRYPNLVRIDGTPDLWGDILAEKK